MSRGKIPKNDANKTIEQHSNIQAHQRRIPSHFTLSSMNFYPRHELLNKKA